MGQSGDVVTAYGKHMSHMVNQRVADKLQSEFEQTQSGRDKPIPYEREFDWCGWWLTAEDETPADALTRLAWMGGGFGGSGGGSLRVPATSAGACYVCGYDLRASAGRFLRTRKCVIGFLPTHATISSPLTSERASMIALAFNLPALLIIALLVLGGGVTLYRAAIKKYEEETEQANRTHMRRRKHTQSGKTPHEEQPATLNDNTIRHFSIYNNLADPARDIWFRSLSPVDQKDLAGLLAFVQHLIHTGAMTRAEIHGAFLDKLEDEEQRTEYFNNIPREEKAALVLVMKATVNRQ